MKVPTKDIKIVPEICANFLCTGILVLDTIPKDRETWGDLEVDGKINSLLNIGKGS
jgi:hypothetical protein